MSLIDSLSAAGAPAIVNERTGRVLASTVEVARTSAARRRGLLGRRGLPREAALVLSRCNAVHTIGMRFPIDVAFVDASGRVRKIVRELAPWRLAVSPFASVTIEFAAGSLGQQVVAVGDRLIVA
jgi:uncharacterized membrane protein (UPF0127 family)